MKVLTRNVSVHIYVDPLVKVKQQETFITTVWLNIALSMSSRQKENKAVT